MKRPRTKVCHACDGHYETLKFCKHVECYLCPECAEFYDTADEPRPPSKRLGSDSTCDAPGCF